MEILNKVVENFDFNHCVEREGFIFTSIMEPANILDAIVIRNPETSMSITPQKSSSKKTLKEHIDLINLYQLEKACVTAENLEFLLKCPSLKYLQIIPAKTASENFDYSPLYNMPEIKYLMAVTEYRDPLNPTITSIDYSKIDGLKEVRIEGKGHQNYNQIDTVEYLYISNVKLLDFVGMERCKNLKKLDLLQTKIKSLKGIEHFQCLQGLSLEYERYLNDVSEIVNVSKTLKALSISNCPKIMDFSFLEQMGNLECLELNGKNVLPNLNFLKEMPQLRSFVFSMEVADGDLRPCLDIPYVYSKKNRKGYNLKDRDLPKNMA